MVLFGLLKPQSVFADSLLSFDEGYGSTINDANGNITGTITNATWKADDLCQSGKCLYFDGTGDYVNFGDAASLDYTASANFTIEGRFRTPNISSGQRTLVAKYNSATGTDGGYKVYMDSNGYLIFGIDNDQTSFPADSVSTTTTAFDDNIWHHFAAVKTGTTSITIYVDGVQFQTDASITQSTLANTDNFYVGIDGDGTSNGFSGFMDDIKIFNSARTANQIKADYLSSTPSKGTSVAFGDDQETLSNGLVGYWNMDESSGNSLDSSGNNNTATGSGNTDSTGGTITHSGGYTIHSFSSNGTLVTTAPTAVEYLVLAGGGGGSANNSTCGGGGGGAGGLKNGTIALLSAGSYNIVVGTGGNGGTSMGSGTVGNDSSFNGIVAHGGGYGAALATGGNGGSGGGGGSTCGGSIHAGGNGTFGEGTNGGYGNTTYGGGGGGGTSSTGANSFDNLTGGYGGNGLALSITGSSVTYGGGGGGGGTNGGSNISGGSGGGGAGAAATAGTQGTDGLGGGGGGGGYAAGVYYNGGKGGDGVVIVRYLTATGAAVGTGKFGNARIFNGSGSYFTLASTPVTGTGSFTISAWIKTSTTGTTKNIISFGSASNTNGISLYINTSNKVQADIYGSTGPQSAVTVTDGAWHFVSVVNDNNSYQIYIDGTASGAAVTQTTNISSSATNIIGANYSATSNWFNGSIDEVRIYTKKLTPSDIQDIYSWGPSAYAIWKFDENNGNKAYDSATASNTGTLNGSPTAKWAQGKFGTSLLFNSSNSNDISIANESNFDFEYTQPFSIAAWVKNTSAASSETKIFSKMSDSSPNTGYEFFISNLNTLQVYLISSVSAPTYISVTGSTSLTDSQWHHVAMTYDGSGLASGVKMYVDGKLETNTVYSNTISGCGCSILNNITPRIGSRNNTNFFFNGQIDDLRVYNYEVSQKQTTKVMNGDHPTPGSPIGSAQGLWRFDEGTGDTLDNSGSCGSACNLARSGSTKPSWTNSGKFSHALNFGGTNAYAVATGDPTAFKITGALTLSAWIYLTDTSSVHDIIAKRGASGNYAYRLFTDTNGKLNFEISKDGSTTSGGTNGATVTGTTTLSTGTWYHVVGVYNPSSSMTIYVNTNVDGSTTTVPSSIKDTTTNLEIGGENTTTNLMNGIIDEAILYNFGLTVSQIAVVYNQGFSSVLGTTSTTTTGTSTDSAQREYCPPGNSDGNCGSGDPSPFAHYTFDTNGGNPTTLNDISGNNLNGSISGNMTAGDWVQGKYGTALDFDGSDDDANIYSSSFDTLFDETKGSVSAWVRIPDSVWADTSTNRAAVQLAADTSNFLALRKTTTANQFGMVFTTGGVTNSSNFTTSTTDWFHVEMTWNKVSTTTTINYYVNGLWQETDTTTTAWTGALASTRANIGARLSTGADNFQGQIDDVRIYNYARSAAQVAWDYNRGKPIVWWKMDEASGNGCPTVNADACDSSGNTYDGTWTGNVTSTTGKFNNGTTFDNAGDYIDAGDLFYSDTISACVWVNPTTIESTDSIIIKRNSSGVTAGASDEYALTFNSDGTLGYSSSNGASTAVSVNGITPVPTGTWTHVCFVQQGNGLPSYVYVNGKQDGTASQTLAMGNTTDHIQLGARSANTDTRYFNGSMDDFRMFAYPLSTQQIQDIMNEGTIRFGP